ncbi:Plant intracellular Ras-group-related LRR protein 4 [Camellia lanceoleosa]|uniref:Plant intracellular Ras-group-related LRR protein 4 n=1 Tax=Camellia lanceoleosa TaxID=1840588 RepID=A0ACC0H3M6_9ERIC|nr:Plant intracellular Ras-group-related LRR protein 4 [Camellia lanceoleosa]
MRNCRSLRSLPESIGCVLTLSTLIIVNAAITELPESIGMLENLIMLRLNKCTKLCRLPASIGNLKSLHHLLMEETVVTELPENFGMLSRLMILKMAKKPDHEVSQNAENTELPSSFSNLSLLEEFDARAWKIARKIPDDFEKLSSLVLLNLSHNDFSSLPCSLSGLSILEKLVLSHCKYLKVLPPLPSSLIELNAANCTALESISDISNLENLRNLNLANCEKLTGIPDWFTRDKVSYSKPKNRVIKAVIVGIVVSIDHSIQDDLRDQSPVVAGILITILRLNVPIFNIAPLLEGVPKTDEDHYYWCRYENHTPLVLFLKDGDKIRVAT